MALTALRVANAKPGTHVDGKGLLLVVRPSGSKSWVLRVQRHGRRRDFGLGSVDWITLAQARAAAATLRANIKLGIETIDRPTQREELAARITVPSFEAAARDCYDALKGGWSDRRKTTWLISLETHIFPLIGKKAVDQINSAIVRDALEPIWLKIPDTSRRILQRITAVLDFAHIKGWRVEETSLRTVKKGLPRQNDRKRHYDAMSFDQVPSLIASLIEKPPNVSRDAMRLLIYTAVRSNEVRNAVWPEFDLDKETWTIPAERMKTRVAHAIPLSAPAVALLQKYWSTRRSDDALVFSINGRRPLSEMTLTASLRAMGIGKCTVHGFRSSFTDWAAERTDFPKEVADKALAHKVADQVEAAYRRTDFFDKRRQLMAQWAGFLHEKAVNSHA
jgi:integrase